MTPSCRPTAGSRPAPVLAAIAAPASRSVRRAAAAVPGSATRTACPARSRSRAPSPDIEGRLAVDGCIPL
ncbi:hypothetical protein FHY26_001600 [Xanthomonas campestris]|uniref:hypothetical protein n=1 Tax=Xanthomonas campestris TaxID=339 RepID=UPI000A683246|nr:hypothetical protein [Xanthomonas campestris]MEB1708034.1 hypothetical protein [Xanthomonas campestris pv. campestris]